MWTRLRRLLRRRSLRRQRLANAALATLAVDCLRRRPPAWRPREMRDWLT